MKWFRKLRPAPAKAAGQKENLDTNFARGYCLLAPNYTMPFLF